LGLATGNGGSPDLFGCLSVLDLASDAGTSIAQSAVSLVIGAAARLAGERASLGDACAGVGLAVGACVAGVMWVQSVGLLDGTGVAARCIDAVT
jgi:hypothetical protein